MCRRTRNVAKISNLRSYDSILCLFPEDKIVSPKSIIIALFSNILHMKSSFVSISTLHAISLGKFRVSDNFLLSLNVIVDVL